MAAMLNYPARKGASTMRKLHSLKYVLCINLAVSTPCALCAGL